MGNVFSCIHSFVWVKSNGYAWCDLLTHTHAVTLQPAKQWEIAIVCFSRRSLVFAFDSAGPMPVRSHCVCLCVFHLSVIWQFLDYMRSDWTRVQIIHRHSPPSIDTTMFIPFDWVSTLGYVRCIYLAISSTNIDRIYWSIYWNHISKQSAKRMALSTITDSEPCVCIVRKTLLDYVEATFWTLIAHSKRWARWSVFIFRSPSRNRRLPTQPN